MPNFSNEFVRELLTVGPFTGLDATTGQYFVDGGMGVDMLNIVPDRRYQSYITVQGRSHALATNMANPVRGMTKFYRQGMTPVYLALNGSVLQSFTLGGSPTTLTLPSGVGPLTGNYMGFAPYQRANSSPINGWMFVSDGTDPPLKVDLNLAVTNWQAAPPTVAPTAASGGAGNVNSINPYYYRFTYSNAALETSPGPVSAGFTATNNQVTVSGLAASADAQVTTINIYRLGGSLGTWFEVGSVPNGTTTFTDNTADASITGQSLVLHRDPPANFLALEVHKDRIWGFGYTSPYSYQFNSVTNTYGATGPQPSDLWYSNYTEPWGFDNTNQVLPIGRNAGGDTAVGLATLGSLLVCFKSKTTWAVYGDTQADFLVRRLFDIGCASETSIVKAYGLVFWLSDRGVFGFDGGDAPQYLSKDIKRILDGYSMADLAAATAFMRYRMYWLSFPTQGVTFGFDIDQQKWFKIGWATDNAVFDVENLNEVTATEVGSGVVDSWYASETDLTLPIVSSFTSRIADSGVLGGTKQYRYGLIQAPVQSGAIATVQVVVDPGPSQKVYTKAVNLALSPPRHLISLTPNMTGFEAQLIVTITSSQQTEVQRVAILGYVKRNLVALG